MVLHYFHHISIAQSYPLELRRGRKIGWSGKIVRLSVQERLSRILWLLPLQVVFVLSLPKHATTVKKQNKGEH